MVFTDPPYSVNYEKKNTEVLKSKSYSKITNDNLSVKDIARDLWKPSFDNMALFAKDGASIYVTMPQGGDQMMMMMMMDSWQVKHELIWVKSSPVFSMGRLDYDYMHEPIIYGWKKNHQFYGNGEHRKSVWFIDRDGNKSHPTMKPVALIGNAINNSSKMEDNILDTFGGSGSTLIACEKLNRKCFMMELDEHYCDVIVKRWEDYTGKKAELL
jgi:DNA modification methylase